LAVDGLRLELAALDRDLGDAARLHLFQELRVLHRRLRGLAGIELVEHGHQYQPDDEPDDQVLEHVVQGLTPVFATASGGPSYADFLRRRKFPGTRRARLRACARSLCRSHVSNVRERHRMLLPGTFSARGRRRISGPFGRSPSPRMKAPPRALDRRLVCPTDW